MAGAQEHPDLDTPPQRTTSKQVQQPVRKSINRVARASTTKSSKKMDNPGSSSACGSSLGERHLSQHESGNQCLKMAVFDGLHDLLGELWQSSCRRPSRARNA